jgi:hypothetical protein
MRREKRETEIGKGKKGNGETKKQRGSSLMLIADY